MKEKNEKIRKKHSNSKYIPIAISKNVDGLSVCEDFFENPVAAIFSMRMRKNSPSGPTFLGPKA